MKKRSTFMGGQFNGDSITNSIIRIPYTFNHKLWMGLIALLAAGFAIAAWIVDPLFLFGILALTGGMSVIGRSIGKSPGKIEFVSENLYLVILRIDNSSFSGDNWQRTVLPTRFKLRVEDTGFRWSDERLEIITLKGPILLGSGKKMLPIRDWLVRHGLQPK